MRGKSQEDSKILTSRYFGRRKRTRQTRIRVVTVEETVIEIDTEEQIQKVVVV